MKIKILGTGGSINNTQKYYMGKYTPSCLIYTDKGNILIDLNEDILEKAANKDLLNVTDVFITHGHHDGISGIKIFNDFLEKNKKFINLYAHQSVIQTIKLRWNSKDRGNYNFNPIHTKKVTKVNEVVVKATKVFHDKRYPTFAYSLDNAVFYGSDMGPLFDEYESKQLNDNILMVIDGTYWKDQPKINNHIAILPNLNKLLSFNNQFIYLIGMADQWKDMDNPDDTLRKELTKYKKTHPKCSVKEIRVLKEGEILDIFKLTSRKNYENIEKSTPNYEKTYELCEIITKLSLKNDKYVVEPVINGKSEIIVNKEKQLIYEQVITDIDKKIMTDVLSYKENNLFATPIIKRLTYLSQKDINNTQYFPIKWVVNKENLAKFLKSIKKNYPKVIIRPSNTKYYEGKFVLDFTEKADNLGQVPDATGSRYLPKPSTGRKRKPKKRKKPKKKEKEIEMKKEIDMADLPADTHKPELIDKVVEYILEVDVFKRAKITKTIPFYKLALYSKALQEFLKDKESKIVNFRWGETYIPASFELLETSRNKKERLLTDGYILIKGKHPLVINFYPTMTCQVINIQHRKEDAEYVEQVITTLNKYVTDNNPWKNEKITPFGKFLPISKLTQSDVILDPNIFKRLDKTVFNFFNNKEKYEKANVPFKRGVIFAGLPGVGKTLCGKIIMNNINDATFIWVTAKDFKKLPTEVLFNMARELQPAILFVEDVDRCLTGSTLDTIKTQMDGLESNDGILTILSTNFPQQLPKTLIDRPGRFDDIIEFNLPNSNLRYEILKYYSKTIEIEDKDNTLMAIAQVSSGLTPAHLKEIVVSSYMGSDKESLTLADLQYSLERIKKLHAKFKSIRKEFIDKNFKKGNEVSKPAPDVTEKYIRWRIKDPKLFKEGSFRTIDLNKNRGIKAILGKYKSDPNGPMHVQSVLFDKEKWTIDKARKWIREHKDRLKDAKLRTVKPKKKKAPAVQVRIHMVEQKEWVCPHCNDVIREKSLYCDGENWYHRPCIDKGPIELPD